MENEKPTERYMKKSYNTIDVPHIPPQKKEIKNQTDD